jgi:hypothetical protein
MTGMPVRQFVRQCGPDGAPFWSTVNPAMDEERNPTPEPDSSPPGEQEAESSAPPPDKSVDLSEGRKGMIALPSVPLDSVVDDMEALPDGPTPSEPEPPPPPEPEPPPPAPDPGGTDTAE